MRMEGILCEQHDEHVNKTKEGDAQNANARIHQQYSIDSPDWDQRSRNTCFLPLLLVMFLLFAARCGPILP
jgi:hypothetical protein